MYNKTVQRTMNEFVRAWERDAEEHFRREKLSQNSLEKKLRKALKELAPNQRLLNYNLEQNLERVELEIVCFLN